MRWLAIAPAIVGTVMTVVGLLLIARTPRGEVPVGYRLEEVLGYLVFHVAFVGVGALLAWRRPENVIGWLLSGVGLGSAIQYVTAGYAIYGLFAGLRGAEVAAWVYTWSGLAMTIFVGAVILTFPDGRPRTRAGRVAIGAIVLAVVLLVALLMARPGPLARFPVVRNPFGREDLAALLDVILALGLIATVASIALAAKQFIDRARQATRLERQQLKLLIWSTALNVVFGLVLLAVILGPGSGDSGILFVANMLAACATATLPIAIGVAVLRYRLYDIDLIVNRTVVYGATSAAIAATFYVGIVALQPVFRSLTNGSELAVAASTLLSFALFQPIRRRVRDTVDRRFNRSHYDAARTLDAFADQLRDEVDLDALRGDLVGAVQTTMAPAHASIWLRERTPIEPSGAAS
jgi:hypothetical protein